MYNLPYFKEKDEAEIEAFIKKYSFAMLCGSDLEGYPVATQIPVFITRESGKILLYGHIMKQTDHHKAFVENPNVLALFTGPHTYVSAAWYTDPKQGSTWNYMTVQVRGKIRFLSEDRLENILRETTAYYENNPESPALYEHLPKEYIGRLIKAIVAFEVEVTGMENVFKLSQNRDEVSYQNIIEKLEKGDFNAQEIAREMKKRHNQLF